MYPCKYDLPVTGNDFCQFFAPHNVYHPGVDFNKGSGNQDCGNEVLAAREGVAIFVNTEAVKGHGFGIFIIIKHSDGTYARYAHLQETSLEKNVKVVEGQQIGKVGNTGTTYCHLHFEVFGEDLAKIQESHTNPWAYYPSGKSKEWIEQHYLNPWTWLKTEPAIPDWAKKVVEKAKKTGIITDWTNPYEVIGGERLEWIFEKIGLLEATKHEGKVTLIRLAMILEKLKKI